jgi:hypothetical protein
MKWNEWLRGVRDTNYELSIKDPEAYQRKRERARGKDLTNNL